MEIRFNKRFDFVNTRIDMDKRWSKKRANEWYNRHPWLVGCNFIPSTAVNQLEMWQADTFDADTIDRELGFAAELGMNSVRVYLHDLVWRDDAEGFKNRIYQFLDLANNHGIITMFVFFDDCWQPAAYPGKQPEPILGAHNHRWVNSPGQKAAIDPVQEERLKKYIQDIVKTFGNDKRVLLWDVYNELGNIFLLTLGMPWYSRIPRLLIDYTKYRFLNIIPTRRLFRQTVSWIREIGPSQPMTAGIYLEHPKLNQELIEASDIISFHNYKTVNHLKTQLKDLKELGRPILCTEYLNRKDGSLFETFLPVFKKNKIGCYNWGFVSGKTQTVHSWQKRGDSDDPQLWFHDILRKDGSPFSQKEVELLKKLIED